MCGNCVILRLLSEIISIGVVPVIDCRSGSSHVVFMWKKLFATGECCDYVIVCPQSALDTYPGVLLKMSHRRVVLGLLVN